MLVVLFPPLPKINKYINNSVDVFIHSKQIFLNRPELVNYKKKIIRIRNHTVNCESNLDHESNFFGLQYDLTYFIIVKSFVLIINKIEIHISFEY